MFKDGWLRTLTWHWRWQRGQHYQIVLLVATPPAAGRWAGWAAWGPASLCCWSAGTLSRPAASAAHCSWNTGQTGDSSITKRYYQQYISENHKCKCDISFLKWLHLSCPGITNDEVVTCNELTSGKGQEGPWLGQISRPPSTDTFKLRIRQGVTRAAEVFSFSATHAAKLVVSQANYSETKQTFSQCDSKCRQLPVHVASGAVLTILTKAEMKTRIMVNTPTRVLLVRDWTIFFETVCIVAGKSCGENSKDKQSTH